MAHDIDAVIDDLKSAGQQPELARVNIDKATALAAIRAIRALQAIGGVPLGRNRRAEAVRMRDLALNGLDQAGGA